MGVPSVFPSNSPEDDLRAVILLARCRDVALTRPASIELALDLLEGELHPQGQPSMATPTAPPCDSPHVVIRNAWPKVFPMGVSYHSRGWASTPAWNGRAACRV